MEIFFFIRFSFSFIGIVDLFSLLFRSFVVLISSFIILYRGFYISEDLFFNRFITIIIIFVLSIIILVFGGNLFSLIVGWDGLGLVSFCLVIYYSNKDSISSGILTIIMNRVGDGFILLAIFFFRALRVFNTDLLFERSLGSFLLMFSFFTKRAQFPFSSWLPVAIAAPTPISSLVHSSTLVTAGIYLSIRFSFIFTKISISNLIIIVSLLTILLGGRLALIEKDFKKIVAMSTLRQLGFMFFMISIGSIKLAFFHIICHAFFKSLLFIRVGRIIIRGRQDSRYCYSLISPIIISSLIISLFPLIGIPFTIGFYSKDLSLDFLFNRAYRLLFYLLFLIGSLATIVYSLRILLKIIPFFFGGSTITLINYSLFFQLRIIIRIIVNILIGKILFNIILIEDFVLIRFPLKSVGFIIIFVGLVFNLKINYFLYIFLSWFKSTMSLSFLFDYFFKTDQLWIENISLKSINSFISISLILIDLNIKILWTSFMIVWFILFFFLSLTT